MAGYEVVKVGTDEHGGVDLDDLRAKADDDVACLMLDQPEHARRCSTATSRRSRRIVHGVGATLYYDGANLNAVMGRTRPGRHGLRHRPLQPAQDVHAAARRRRTRRRPDRGRQSGSSRTCRGRRSCAARRRHAIDLDYDRPKSIGRLRGFQGNYGVFVRSYAYIRSLGGDGLREVSETAVLNANYLLARLRAAGRHRAPPARLRPSVHARVRAVRRADEARAGHAHARPGQAPARPRLPPADGLLPAARRRGAAGRADRDRDQGDARRVRRGARRDPRRGRARTRRSPATRRTGRPSGGSTRPAPPSTR